VQQADACARRSSFRHSVSVLCRDAAQEAPLLAAGASSVLVGAATDSAFLSRAIATANPGLILTAVGTSPPELACSGVDAPATAALASAAAASAAAPSLHRFVLISALGVAESLDCLPHASQDVLAPWLAAKAKAEDAVTASGLPWTIIRPGPLTDGPPSGRVVTTLDAASGAFLHGHKKSIISARARAPHRFLTLRARISSFCLLILRPRVRPSCHVTQARRSARWAARTWLPLPTRRACLRLRVGARCACWTRRA
jgi:uncharacterized protein YbjT (DUF2867 family)